MQLGAIRCNYRYILTLYLSKFANENRIIFRMWPFGAAPRQTPCSWHCNSPCRRRRWNCRLRWFRAVGRRLGPLFGQPMLFPFPKEWYFKCRTEIVLLRHGCLGSLGSLFFFYKLIMGEKNHISQRPLWFLEVFGAMFLLHRGLVRKLVLGGRHFAGGDGYSHLWSGRRCGVVSVAQIPIWQGTMLLKGLENDL